MATTQYIGARYVPLFSDPLDWDNTKAYEALTIVYYQGNSYTSRQSVPKGVEITNDKYWALTGNYNAQIETYRKEVTEVVGKADEAVEKATEAETKVATEETRATNAENELATGISNLGTRITEAETKVTTEETRAKAAEEKINDAVITANVASAEMRGIVPIMRAEATIDGTRYNPQGSFFTKNNETGQTVGAIYYVASDDASLGYLKSYLNGVEVSSKNINNGHGASMAFFDGYIYIPDNSNDHTVYKYPFNIKTGVLGSKQYAFPSLGRSCSVAIDKNGTFYLIENETVNVVDPTSGSVQNSFPIDFQEQSINLSLGQSMSVLNIGNDIYFAKLASQPNIVSICDKNGEYVKTCSLPAIAGYIALGEVQSLTFDTNGDFYLCSSDGSQPTAITKTATIFKGNIFGKCPTYDDRTIIRNGGQTLFIKVDPLDSSYNLPHKPDEGEISASNQVGVKYCQDVTSVIKSYGCNYAEIEVVNDTNFANGLYLNGGTYLIKMNSKKLSTIYLRDCVAKVIEMGGMFSDGGDHGEDYALQILHGSVVTCNTGGGTSSNLYGSYCVFISNNKDNLNNISGSEINRIHTVNPVT